MQRVKNAILLPVLHANLAFSVVYIISLQIQADDVGRLGPVEDLVGVEPADENSDAAKSEAKYQSGQHGNDAEQNQGYDESCAVFRGLQFCGLVPSDISVIVHGGEQRLGFIGRDVAVDHSHERAAAFEGKGAAGERRRLHLRELLSGDLRRGIARSEEHTSEL